MKVPATSLYNISLDASEHLLLVYVDEDTLAPLYQHDGLNSAFAPLR